MQRDDAPAICACPLFLFFEQMLFCSHSFGADTILDQVDMVSQPVTFINPLNGGAGKGRTLAAIIESLTHGTFFDFAFPAMFRLVDILSPASRAGFLLSELRIANGAGDSTGSQHVRWNFDYYFLFLKRNSCFV